MLPSNKLLLENNLKRELVNACCRVFQWQSDREIALVGCVAVTIKSKSSKNSPLLYFVHMDQVLEQKDYVSCQDLARKKHETNNIGSVKGINIKEEPDLAPASFLSVIPAEIIPPGKGFVVKTQTVYEKTADGEERKVSMSTHGLIDACDIKEFAGHPQMSSCKQEECLTEEYGDSHLAYDIINEGEVYTEYDQAFTNNEGVCYPEEPFQQEQPDLHYQPRKSAQGFKARNANIKKRKVIPNQKAKPTSTSEFPVGRGGAFKFSHQQMQQAKTKLSQAKAGASAGRFSGFKMGCATRDPSNPYVLTRSMHECGYPGCNKRFKWKQHLLRHQTEKHGRVPSKKVAFERVFKRNAEYDSSNSSRFCNTTLVDEGDGDYYEDAGEMYSDPVDGNQDYYYQ